MLDRRFGHNTHYYLHLLGFSGIAAGLPLSKAVLSISTLFLLLNLLLKADFRTYWINFRSNILFLLIAGFFLFHVLGLLWSNDLQYGLNDVWKKTPLLLIPAAFIAIPVRDRRDKNLLLVIFLGATFITSMINYLSYQQIFGMREYEGFRDMSLFGSHIRYSLLIVMGIGISYYFVLKRAMIFLFIPVILWFIYYTLYSQVISGLAALAALLITILFYHFYRKRKMILVVLTLLFIGSVTWLAVWIFQPTHPASYSTEQLDEYTKEGHPYVHDFNLIAPETNKPIGIYVCETELKREWNKRSAISYDSLDNKGHHIKQTLKRYMASLDLRKDAGGISKLTPEDIKRIENGCASVYCQGMIARVYGLKYQILNEKNPNGHSFLQRIEYWKAGLNILSQNFIIGVGTGDVQRSFDDYYDEINTPLSEKNRVRAHNTYITVFLTFGIFGFALFLLMHIAFIKQQIRRANLIPIFFIAVVLVSYFMEDTLETQVGVTFFSFFYGLYSIDKE